MTPAFSDATLIKYSQNFPTRLSPLYDPRRRSPGRGSRHDRSNHSNSGVNRPGSPF